MKIEYEEISRFQKDLKWLLKKYPTLEDDLETVKKNAIELYHIGKPDNSGILRKVTNNGVIFPMPGFCSANVQICKIKKFACKALKGCGVKSGIRVIYAFHCVSLKVEFIEIYYKGNKENEDRERIKTYLKSVN